MARTILDEAEEDLKETRSDSHACVPDHSCGLATQDYSWDE